MSHLIGRKWFKKFIRTFFRVAVAIGIALLLHQFDLHYLESWTLDLRVRFRPAPSTSDHIAIVSFDEFTENELKRSPHVEDATQLVQRLTEMDPEIVVFTFDPSDLLGTTEQFTEFAQSTLEVPFYYGISQLPRPGREEELKLKPPLDIIPVIPAPVTSDRVLLARDGVTRRLILTDFETGVKTMHLKLASRINGLTKESDYRGVFELGEAAQALINYRPKGSYPTYHLADVISGQIDKNKIKGKIILVGRDTDTKIEDYVMTPYSRAYNAMTAAEMHANALDTLILNQSPIPSSRWIGLFLTALISLITVFVVLGMRPARGLVVLLATGLVFAFAGLISYWAAGRMIPMAHSFLAIFVCYYFLIPYRLIIENRRSWEYFQKNRLLTEVEELKSNFMRMMSHDLKTPLARIQGMADIVTKENSELLNERQKEALQTINKSTEELSKFISSVLDLSRIESNEIKLHLKSRDFNSLVSEVVQRADYLAREKNIDIRTELEPMFSVKIDEDLIRQVVSNLIENAIKYSPENSKILVTTEEVENRLVLQVADQGIGIPSTEQKNIFTKFYRTSETIDSKVKGSGLGLYLAWYFVNLHHGSIAVESEEKKGSTFIVELPMDLEDRSKIEVSGHLRLMET